jgi:predicted RNase H-like nuclease (RuvC/YqgF family)
VIKKVTKPLWVVLATVFLLTGIGMASLYFEMKDKFLMSIAEHTEDIPPADTISTEAAMDAIRADSLSNALADLQQQLSAAGNNTAMQQIINDKSAEIMRLEADKKSLQTQLTAAKNNSGGNTANLQTQINNLKAQIKQKDNSIAQLNARITQLINQYVNAK